MYFAKYWDFLGEAREEFLAYFMKGRLPELLQSGVNLVTASVSGKYLKPLFVYDDIRVNIRVTRLSKASFDLSFNIVNQHDDTVFTAKMEICTSNGKNLVKLPQLLYDSVKVYV